MPRRSENTPLERVAKFGASGPKTGAPTGKNSRSRPPALPNLQPEGYPAAAGLPLADFRDLEPRLGFPVAGAVEGRAGAWLG